ncbi:MULTISPECIES: hypothetical protein [unclassified Aminobacter]|uniref:hypothetical protein n=1 Tax=unclassified Aminobacter TaxID=2644704 RepID=UPI000465A135|nr:MULTISPECIES: hypothetical protein [unclassified Aminobacter]TWH31036.1 hypothetical protein L611_002900000190 [Aminobacter sp. J15]
MRNEAGTRGDGAAGDRLAGEDAFGRIVLGAVAGFCATMAMTAAMRALHAGLEPRDRYPLPPREITEGTLPVEGRAAGIATILTHFGYGAVTGAIFGALPRGVPGLLYGPAVWAASYLGWIPAANILKPATRHPAERNLLMLAVHLVWGGCLAFGLRELEAASRSAFGSGRLHDRPEGSQR